MFFGYTKPMSGRQTKTVLNPEQREALARGAIHFNGGRFFEAHEAWELRWRKLPLPDRPQVQAAILVCGVFVLLGKGRIEPAARLARLSLERFAEASTAAKIYGLAPALSLPGSEERMVRILGRIALGETDSTLLVLEAENLQAVVDGVP